MQQPENVKNVLLVNTYATIPTLSLATTVFGTAEHIANMIVTPLLGNVDPNAQK